MFFFIIANIFSNGTVPTSKFEESFCLIESIVFNPLLNIFKSFDSTELESSFK